MAIQKVMSPEEYYKKLSKDDKVAVVDLSKPTKIDFIPTGSWVLNMIIGDGSNKGKPGGLPRGHVVEVMGDESSGKTTLAMSACKQAQKLNCGPVVFVDYERSFHEVYAKNMGIDLSRDKFILIRPDHFQHGEALLNDAILMKPPLIIIDSVSAMIPSEFLEGTVDDSGRIGLHAQYMSKFLSRITKMLPQTNTCLLLVNQIRSLIKKSQYDAGPDEESTGGRALRYYASVRIKLRKGQVENIMDTSKITGKEEKKAVNIIVKATAIKNRIDRPFITGPVYIRFGEGFDNILSIIELAVNQLIVKKNAAFYRFDIGDQTLFNAQGKEELRDILVKDPKILKKLQDSLRCVEDVEAKKEFPEEADIKNDKSKN